MDDGADRGPHRIVEEGTRAAQQPPLEQLLRRVRRRRARRRTACVTLAVAVLVIPVAWFIGQNAGPGLSTPPARTPTATATPAPLSAQQRAETAAREAARQAGSLTVTPKSVLAGGSVRVDGQGCTQGGSVSLGFGASPGLGLGTVTTVQVGPRGSFQGTVTIPANAALGAQQLWAQCTTRADASPLIQYGALYVSAS
jgi:hypothetical protein